MTTTEYLPTEFKDWQIRCTTDTDQQKSKFMPVYKDEPIWDEDECVLEKYPTDDEVREIVLDYRRCDRDGF